MSSKLTVIIPCKDERLNIRPCIEAVQDIASEILVADSGSTDGTLDIVRDIGGCRIIEREYIHSGNFKNWAIPQAAHDWVLLVDADERITPQLAAEIKRVLAEPAQDGYWIYRANYFMGHRIHFGPWCNDKCLRLFKRDLSQYVGDNDHAEVRVDSGRVGRLKAKMDHFTYWTYNQYFHKFHRYTSYQAGVWHAAQKKQSFVRMLLTVPVRFFHGYVIKGGFLDGYAGLQVCMLTAFYSFTKQARLWALTHGLERPDPEAERQQTLDRAAQDNEKIMAA